MPDVPDIIRIRTTLTSDTPHLPELAPWVGRAVEIVVVDAAPTADPLPDDRPPTPQELAVREAAMTAWRESDYDRDAWREQRAFDFGVADEELRKWQEEQRHEGQR